MKLAIVLGTRPEIIKLSPIIRACEERGVDYFIVHSGQHYSSNLDAAFFRNLKLPKPKYNAHIGKLEYRKRVGFLTKRLVDIFEKEWPDVIMVEGDTFTVLVGALAAKKLDRPVAHLEAGLRSHDLSMPEEINRIIVDHVAELLYPPTKDAARNLREEGLDPLAAPVFGNTVVDAVLQNLKISEERADVLGELGLRSKAYVLVTAHRQENVDRRERLASIIQGLVSVKRNHPNLTVLFPIHPRTDKMMKKFGIPRPREVRFIEPPPWPEFLQLEKHAALFITDSGGLQEEATVLKVPCVTIRDNTERPETIEAGMNVLAGADSKRIAAAASTMLKARIRWKPLYGDGTAAMKTIAHLERAILRRKTVGRVGWYAKMARRLIGGK